ncbi:MAG: family 16 glycoside hydrolase [Fibrobacteria bacterium]
MSQFVNRFARKWVQASIAIVVGAFASASAQSFSHADSGWVKIWNGKDWTENDIYSRVYGAGNVPLVYPPVSTWQILYAGTDTAAIYVSSTSANNGNIGTKKTSYSHYRMRVEEKFDAAGASFNGGLTYHTDETKSRMQNNWPRSIEFQMQQKEPGSAYSIQQLTFDTKVTGSNYNANGSAVTACETGPLCNSRQYYSNPNLKTAGSDGKPRWLRFELVVRGSDSAIHIINDTVVFRLSNLRVYNDKANNTPDGPVDHGGFGLQSEGALIKYRRWEVMEFPAATPKGENFLHRFFIDAPAKGGTATIAGGGSYTIKWRTLGTVPTVNIEYGTGASGAWQSVAANVNNTGTYDWAVPASVTGQVRVRISGPAWAGADSSNATGPTGIHSGNPRPGSSAHPITFSIEGKGQLISNIEMYAHLEIRDVFGREVRNFPIKDRNLAWDRKDAKGMTVQPGFYFLRLLGNGAEKTVRALIF